MADSYDLNFKKSLIKKQAIFAQLKDEELEVLASLLAEKHYSPGQTIVTEGDAVDSVYLIVTGTADVKKLVIKDNVNEMVSLATLGPGEAIGLSETGFYSLSGRRTASVVALTDMVLFRLSVAAFHGFALAYSHVSEVMRNNARTLLGLKS